METTDRRRDLEAINHVLWAFIAPNRPPGKRPRLEAALTIRDVTEARYAAERVRADQDRMRSALEAIANAEIPGVSGGPNGASVEVMEFARRALDDPDA